MLEVARGRDLEGAGVALDDEHVVAAALHEGGVDEAPVQLCDQDGACFDCGSGEVAIGIAAKGSGCDGQIVCDGVEFRVDCDLADDFSETCSCQVDREIISTFLPTELCAAENVDTRALNECGWTLGRSE